MELSIEQIDLLRQAPELHKAVSDYLHDKGLITAPASALAQSDWDSLHDAVMNALHNDAPVVRDYCAEMSKGIFPIVIVGVPGGYFVKAQEFDPIGLFSSLDEAEDALISEYGEFIVDYDD
jgi:hypothetical protein